MNTFRKILEYILITLIFYALYQLSLQFHTHFFENEDPAIFVLISFVLSFFLIFLYRFSVSHGVKRQTKERSQQLSQKKEEKERILTSTISKKEEYETAKEEK